jgi:signal transduction histidine kinase/ActR/RegA family two-component response regulator
VDWQTAALIEGAALLLAAVGCTWLVCRRSRQWRFERGYRAAVTNAFPARYYLLETGGRICGTESTDPSPFGLPASLTCGRRFRDLLPAQAAEEFDCLLNWPSEIGARPRLEFITPTDDEKGRTYDVRVADVINGNWLVIVRDITEKKQVEQEQRDYAVALESLNRTLEEFYTAAETATRAKSEFLANMSHEIRTPMTAILGYTDMLLADDDGIPESPERLEAMRTIKRNGEFLLEIINDILDVSKIESGKLEVEQVKFSPHQVISDVLTLMQMRADAKKLGLQVRYQTWIPAMITSDPTRLRQILINLVGNAIKFTESGTVQLVVSLTGTEYFPQLQFEVIDSGIGIQPDQIDKLFRPFSQADASTTRKYGGTGLGLTISKRLAEFLGGTITVTSKCGEGSTFTATIGTGSIAGVALIRDPSEASPAAATTASAGARIKLTCRVLLAEDGPDNQRLISHVLRKAGADVTIVENGARAVAAILEPDPGAAPFDVVLMDMQMPVLDGYGATAQLRDADCQLPIIALTAHAMSGDREKCLSAGCNDYATKPIDRGALLETVARWARCTASSR